MKLFLKMQRANLGRRARKPGKGFDFDISSSTPTFMVYDTTNIVFDVCPTNALNTLARATNVVNLSRMHILALVFTAKLNFINLNISLLV